MNYNTPEISIERRNRIRLSVAAYAYEFENDSIMSDADFDNLAAGINLKIDTGNWLMDSFFRTQFQPHTGQWIYHHPGLQRLRGIYRLYHADKVGDHWYDLKYNTNLFGEILTRPEPVKHPCRVCGKDVTKNPMNNGCHC